jgi:hypothetical protein
MYTVYSIYTLFSMYMESSESSGTRGRPWGRFLLGSPRLVALISHLTIHFFLFFFEYIFNELQEHRGLTARTTTRRRGTEEVSEVTRPHGNVLARRKAVRSAVRAGERQEKKRGTETKGRPSGYKWVATRAEEHFKKLAMASRPASVPNKSVRCKGLETMRSSFLARV